jgi:hypothetical protein
MQHQMLNFPRPRIKIRRRPKNLRRFRNHPHAPAKKSLFGSFSSEKELLACLKASARA